MYHTERSSSSNWLLGTREANIAYALLRVFAGAAFVTHGYGKLMQGLYGYRMYLINMDIPYPGFLSYFIPWLEIFGGALLLLGILTRVVAFSFGVKMLGAVLVIHAGQPFMYKELSLLYLFVMFLFLSKGGGVFSVDHAMTRPQRRFRR